MSSHDLRVSLALLKSNYYSSQRHTFLLYFFHSKFNALLFHHISNLRFSLSKHLLKQPIQYVFRSEYPHVSISTEGYNYKNERKVNKMVKFRRSLSSEVDKHLLAYIEFPLLPKNKS